MFLAGLVAHVLTTLSASSLHDVTFRVQGDRTSPASIDALCGARVPPVPIAHVTELPEGFVKQTFLQKKFDQGRSSSGWDNYIDKDVPENADSGIKAWEGHKWRSVKEVLCPYLLVFWTVYKYEMTHTDNLNPRSNSRQRVVGSDIVGRFLPEVVYHQDKGGRDPRPV